MVKLAALLFLGSALHGSLAFADDESESLELFVRGTEAVASGRSAEGARLFARALSLSPRPSTAFNLAITYRGLGQSLAAERVLQAALAGDYGDPGELRPLMEERLAEVRREIVHVRVDVSFEERPTEFWVQIDGERARPDASGAYRVDAGHHVLRVECDACATYVVRRVFALRERHRMQVELRALREPGLLVVDVNDDDGQIRVDSAAHGSTAHHRARGRFERRLQPGVYQVAVASGGRNAERTVELASRSRLVLDLDLSGLGRGAIATLVTAGVFVGAAAVIGIVFATRPPDPTRDPVWGNTQVLRSGASVSF